MRTRVLLSALLAISMLSLAAAGPTDPPQVPEDPEDASTVVDKVVGTVEDAAGAVGSAVEATGDGIAGAAGAVGSGLVFALQWTGDAFLMLGTGLLTAGLSAADLAGTAAAAIGHTLLDASGVAGRALVVSLAAIGSGAAWLGGVLASAFAALAGLYASLVGALRGDVPRPVFISIIAAGGVASTAIAGWSGWALLRKLGWVPGLGLVAGFSRIDDSALLEHPLRQQILQVIQQKPGIHASALARDLGVGWGTLVHHVDKMEKARLVTARRVNNQKCFFEQGGMVSRQDMEVASAVRGDTAGQIAGFVHAHPMASQKTVAEALKISPALASFHVKKLVHLGVLEKVRRGRETLLATSDSLRRVMQGQDAPMLAVPRVVAPSSS